jgi:hypothetical protein
MLNLKKKLYRYKVILVMMILNFLKLHWSKWLHITNAFIPLII